MVRGLFSSLDIGTCIPSTCGPSGNFLGSFGGAWMPQNSIESQISLWASKKNPSFTLKLKRIKKGLEIQMKL